MDCEQVNESIHFLFKKREMCERPENVLFINKFIFSIVFRWLATVSQQVSHSTP